MNETAKTGFKVGQMSDVTISTPARLDSQITRRLGFVFLATFGALLAIASVQLLDPLVRHDDFPALLGDPEEFVEKTLTEGRWIPYYWHLRTWVWSAVANFVIYTGLWAAFCAAFAVSTLGRSAPIWHTVVLSLLIAVAPAATLMSVWFNTQIPNVAVITTYALLSIWLSDRTMRWLLYLFVPLAVMAYTTHALLILLICIARAETNRSFRDLVEVIAHFVASFALGILTIYTLNYLVYGVFGIPLADWRSPNPATDIASLMQNLSLAMQVQAKFVFENAFSNFGLAAVHTAVFVFAIVEMIRRDLWRALYLLAGFAMGVSVITMQVVTTGVDTPTRTSAYMWITYSILLVSLIPQTGENLRIGRRALRLFAIFLILWNAQVAFKFYSRFPTWQIETRALAQKVPSGTGPIYVLGDYMTIPGAKEAGIQFERGLRMRMRYITGERFVVCNETPARCEDAFANGTPERVMVLPSDPDARLPGA